MVLMVYVTNKGPRSDCLLADMKQIDQTTKVIRHLAPLDDFFSWGGGGGGGGGRGGEGEGSGGMGWCLQPFQEYFTYIEPIVHQR